MTDSVDRLAGATRLPDSHERTDERTYEEVGHPNDESSSNASRTGGLEELDSSRTWTVVLPYLTPPLSLNDRRHWAVVHKTRKDLTGQVRQLVRAQRIPRVERVHVVLRYVPARKRVRDSDNLVATLKPCIDGLRDYPARYAMLPSRTRLHGVDKVLTDPGWVGIVADDDPTHVTWEPPVIEPVDKDHKGGRLSLTITEVQG